MKNTFVQLVGDVMMFAVMSILKIHDKIIREPINLSGLTMVVDGKEGLPDFWLFVECTTIKKGFLSQSHVELRWFYGTEPGLMRHFIERKVNYKNCVWISMSRIASEIQ